MRRTLKLPVMLATLTIPLSIFVLSGWVIVVLQNQQLSQQVSGNSLFMFSGIISLLIIMAVIIILSVFLGREILEVRQQERFIDSVTHELKSPLASLRLCAQTLSRSDLPQEKKGRLMQMMMDDIDRLHFFIDDVLEVSQLGHRSKIPATEIIGLQQLLDVCCKRIQQRYHLDESVLTMRIESNIAAFAAKHPLEMVLQNLLDNAVKYSTTPKRIVVEAKKIGSTRLEIRVTDNGIGIEKPQQRRIFDRFYRGSSEAVRNQKGTGIGLYIASEIVKGFGSKLYVHSDGLEKGTTFWFRLPLAHGENT